MTNCPNCEALLETEDQKYCGECGVELTGVEPQQNTELMYKGHVNCECGQTFSYETVNTTIACIKCGKVHNTEV